MVSILFLFALSSCGQGEPIPLAPSHWQRIHARDEGDPIFRHPLYSAKVPDGWVRLDPSSEESIADTTKSLCEFSITDESKKIRITVHNFPLELNQQRIPPIAQLNRWRGQFERLDPALTMISPQSHGGFVGLFLECQGILQGQPATLLGWSMQLAPEYHQSLEGVATPLSKHEKADYTIKATGDPDLMREHRQAIIAFANSLELIEELNPL
jgi:hypothetical protein